MNSPQGRGRPLKRQLQLSEGQRRELEEIIKQRRNRALMFRARIILKCDSGLSNSKVSTRAIKRASHCTVLALETAIKNFIEVHNESPKPFRWTKSADEILENLKRFAAETAAIQAGNYTRTQ